MSGFTSGMRSSNSNEWTTPRDLFDELDAEFHFDLDAASTHENALCETHYTAEEDGLSQPWEGFRTWCNPPYGREIGKWVRKAAETAGGGGRRSLRPRPHRHVVVARLGRGPRDGGQVRQGPPQVRGRQELGAVPVRDRRVRQAAEPVLDCEIGKTWKT